MFCVEKRDLTVIEEERENSSNDNAAAENGI